MKKLNRSTINTNEDEEHEFDSWRIMISDKVDEIVDWINDLDKRFKTARKILER